MPKRHAEIAGAGITGLAAAAALAQNGWSVRVHERSPDLREIGAGIYLKENSIRVLKAVGAFDRLSRSAVRLMEGRVFDERQRLLLHRLTHGEQSWACLRQELHQSLSEAAVAHGADIVTDSAVEGATADGKIVLSNGRQYSADLVIGADGYQSKVRESLGLTKSLRTLSSGATRLLVPRSERERTPMQQEHWSRDCRLGFTPCSPDDVYIFLVSPVDNRAGTRVPVDRDFWIGRFPHMDHLIARITDDVGTYAPFVLGDVHAWYKGRAAVMGDAAHAQPPNLGQGAGLGIANGFALAAALSETADVPAALAAWEAAHRPASEQVKIWSYRYGLLASHWPRQALLLRAALIWGLGHNGLTRRRWAWLWRGGMEPGAEQG